MADSPTRSLAPASHGAEEVQSFTLTVVDGPNSGQTWTSSADRCAIGSHGSNDLCLDDPTVSRFHCELVLDEAGSRVRDVGSRNGTVVDGLRVVECWLRTGALLKLGTTTLRFEVGPGTNRLSVSAQHVFGALRGRSVAMRAAFALLEKAAASSATVLLEGETGTGKEAAAQSIHDEGPRRDAPFGVVDCSALPATLLESELFGHVRGAFTGAAEDRAGIFEDASGGTVFLDEIGELPLDLQPKLLRVLEERQVRRVGANRYVPIDVRVIAATNRDLRAEVNSGRFRADLYFRLAVLRIVMPPLRARPDDLPPLVEHVLAGLDAGPEAIARFTAPDVMSRLQGAAWPGNVRELRNYLERCLVLEDAPPLEHVSPDLATTVDPRLPFAQARERALAAFERAYVEALLRAHDGKVAAAARAADVHRNYLYKLMHRHRIAPR